MTDARVDLDYLAWQYSDAEKLRDRIEAHDRHSERAGNFRDWLIDHAQIESSMTVLDAGCGPGTYHPAIAGRGARVVAADMSRGMLAEAAAQAREGGLSVAVVAADAQALPFMGGVFDRVLANHMLYHVPDRERALRELRRVLRRGGCVILATNAADNLGRLDALHDAAARACGFAPSGPDAARFTLDDRALVRSVFPSARVLVRDDAFVFPDTASALRYYASYQVDSIEDRPPDGSHRPLLLASMRRRVDGIIAQEGVFRVPKSAGCFVAGV